MKKANRLPGFLYLGMIVFGIIAQIIRSNILVFGDNAKSFEEIIGSSTLLRLAFMSDLIMMVFYLLTAWALYTKLKSINKSQSLLFLIFTIVSVAIMSGNMLNNMAIIEITNVDYTKFNDLTLVSQFYANLHKYGYLIAQIYFGLWLLPLGIIILKSKIMPKYFGIMLIAATFGCLLEIFVTFLFPGNDFITYPGLIVGMVGEFSFCFWLLFKGLNVDKE
jgi:nitrate reductase NapE component